MSNEPAVNSFGISSSFPTLRKVIPELLGIDDRNREILINKLEMKSISTLYLDEHDYIAMRLANIYPTDPLSDLCHITIGYFISFMDEKLFDKIVSRFLVQVNKTFNSDLTWPVNFPWDCKIKFVDLDACLILQYFGRLKIPALLLSDSFKELLGRSRVETLRRVCEITESDICIGNTFSWKTLTLIREIENSRVRILKLIEYISTAPCLTPLSLGEYIRLVILNAGGKPKASEKKIEIFLMRFSASGVNRLTLDEVGNKVNASRQRVQQIETEGMARIQKKDAIHMFNPIFLLAITKCYENGGMENIKNISKEMNIQLGIDCSKNYSMIMAVIELNPALRVLPSIGFVMLSELKCDRCKILSNEIVAIIPSESYIDITEVNKISPECCDECRNSR